MNSKKIPFYNILFILTIISLCIAWLFIAPDPSPASWFGPAIYSFFILANPAFWLWIFISIISWITAHFLTTEKAIRRMNWFLVALPFISYTLFTLIVLLNS